MKMRLIDADVLKAKLQINPKESLFGYAAGYRDARCVAIDAIDAEPTIDAKVIRHGRWLQDEEPDDNNNILCECSICGSLDEMSIGAFENKEVRWCWYCGTRMDGDENAAD